MCICMCNCLHLQFIETKYSGLPPKQGTFSLSFNRKRVVTFRPNKKTSLSHLYSLCSFCTAFYFAELSNTIKQNLLNKETTAQISNSMVEIYCVYLEVIFTLGVSIWPLPVSLTLLENSMDRNVKTFPDHLYQELFNVKVWCCLKNFLQHFFKMLLKIVNTSLNIYFQITFYKKVTSFGKTTNVLALLYFQQ